MTCGTNQIVLQKTLSDRFADLRFKNPNFSLRAFANKLDISPAALSEIMRGKRRASEKLTYRLIERLQLSPKEASSVLGRDEEQGILPFHRPRPMIELSEESFQIVSDWYYFAILSLAETDEFEGSSSWIASRLNLQIDVAAAALARLAAAELLICKGDGSYAVTGKAFRTTEEIPSLAVQKAHRQDFDLAKMSLEQDPISEREFRSMTMAIDPSRLPEAKKLVSEFVQRLSVFMEEGEKKEVYKLSIQLFPLSKKRGCPVAI